MQRYLDVSTQIYKTYLRYVSPADIYPYSIDEVFIDVTGYLPYNHMSAHELAMTMVREVLYLSLIHILKLDRTYAKEILNSIGASQSVTDRERAQIALSLSLIHI